MRIIVTLITMVMLSLFSTGVFADSLDDRLKVLEENQRRQEQTIDEQRKLIEELKTRIKQNQPSAGGSAAEQAAPAGEMQKKVEELNDKVDAVVEAQRKVLPSEFNPAIGVVGETVFSYRSKPRNVTGADRPGGWDVNQRSVELNVAASVDPFAKAYVVANASADAQTAEANFGIEEAALQTTSLPWNLELKAGRFFGEFGRLAYIHDHELPFVNRPLALDQYIGGESRTDGLQINWLLPIEHYVSWTAGLGTQFGGDNPSPNYVGDFRNPSGLNYWSRLSTYFDLTPNVSLEPGISALWNPHTKAQWDPGVADLPTNINNNMFTERERRLYGADLVLNYKPLRDNQFRSLTWATEVLLSDNRYDITDPSGNALPGQSVGSVGLYSYLTYKFSREWSAGFMYEWMENQVDNKDRTSAYSPYITWATSHWNQIRLQYTHTDHNASSPLKSDDAVYVQWAWIIGAHSHGWQQR